MSPAAEFYLCRYCGSDDSVCGEVLCRPKDTQPDEASMTDQLEHPPAELPRDGEATTTVERCPNAGKYPYATCLLPVGHPGECITEGRPSLKYHRFYRLVCDLMEENDRLRARLSPPREGADEIAQLRADLACANDQIESIAAALGMAEDDDTPLLHVIEQMRAELAAARERGPTLAIPPKTHPTPESLSSGCECTRCASPSSESRP